MLGARGGVAEDERSSLKHVQQGEPGIIQRTGSDGVLGQPGREIWTDEELEGNILKP